MIEVLEQIVVAAVMVFVGFVSLRPQQNTNLNWAMFYASLYVAVALPIVNSLCVTIGFWKYTESSAFSLPVNLYFIWVVLFSAFPVFFFKGKHIFLIAIALFWLDLLLMPQLAAVNFFSLNSNWLYGEFLIITLVFLPAYFWAYCSINKKHIVFRAMMQVLVIGGIFFIGLPAALQAYELIPYQKLTRNPILFQALFIIAFPSLIAVYDLVYKGGGTPFPYDPTQNLVQTGVYAYCRNPIQWSFTFAFIPIAIYSGSSAMLLGSFSSIVYSFAVSDPQEYPDMKERFGSTWDTYKSNVPKWRFLWRPNSIPKGTIYFDEHCNQCSQISQWFLTKKTIHLGIETVNHFPKKHILQATYIDHHGKEYRSVKAIAHCLEHINLAYAALGWFMRFPVISHFLQLIVNSLEIQQIKECDT